MVLLCRPLRPHVRQAVPSPLPRAHPPPCCSAALCAPAVWHGRRAVCCASSSRPPHPCWRRHGATSRTQGLIPSCASCTLGRWVCILRTATATPCRCLAPSLACGRCRRASCSRCGGRYGWGWGRRQQVLSALCTAACAGGCLSVSAQPGWPRVEAGYTTAALLAKSHVMSFLLLSCRRAQRRTAPASWCTPWRLCRRLRWRAAAAQRGAGTRRSAWCGEALLPRGRIVCDCRRLPSNC